MAKILPISEVKTHLPALVAGVEEREEEVVVTRNGRPAAVLVNYAEYERLKETLDVLTDSELMRQIRKSRSFYRSGKRGLSFEDLFGEPLLPPKRRR
jgi:prevent-host-death family protein